MRERKCCQCTSTSFYDCCRFVAPRGSIKFSKSLSSMLLTRQKLLQRLFRILLKQLLTYKVLSCQLRCHFSCFKYYIPSHFNTSLAYQRFFISCMLKMVIFKNVHLQDVLFFKTCQIRQPYGKKSQILCMFYRWVPHGVFFGVNLY